MDIQTALLKVGADITTPTGRLLMKLGRVKYNQFIANYTNIFNAYVMESKRKTEVIRNILYRDQSAILRDKYVSCDFKIQHNALRDSLLLEQIKNGARVIVRGRGGAGKTIFARWVFLELNDSIDYHQMIPLYFELREFDWTHKRETLEECLFHNIDNRFSKPNLEQFCEGLRSGIFVIIIDAVDEVPKSQVTSLIHLIRRFARTYLEVGILITSRDIDEIAQMSEFTYANALPLNKSQVIRIIEKLDYNPEVINALVLEIDNGLFESHKGLLSNPLLATVMLLTYDQVKEVPRRQSLFFRRAFDTLFDRHDGSKGVYSRDHYTNLAIDEFERVFATFCYGTYINSVFEFSHSELVRTFRASADMCNITVDPLGIAKDSVESVCLIVRDGGSFEFIHRSFQEYFACVFVRLYKKDDVAAVIGDLLSRGRGESVGELLFEMEEEIVERLFARPLIYGLFNDLKLGENPSGTDILRAAKSMFDFMRVNPRTGQVVDVRLRSGSNMMKLRSVFSLFPAISMFLYLRSAAARSFIDTIQMEKLANDKSFRSPSLNSLREIAGMPDGDEYQPALITTHAPIDGARWS